MTEPNFICYCINLDERQDRAAIARNRLEKIDIDAIRISAINREQIGFLENTANQHYFQGVVACRMSHVKSMEIFLESDYDYCLILENDFIFENFLTKKAILELPQQMKNRNIRLLQIGHLLLGNSFEGVFASFFRLFNKCVLPFRIFLYRKIFQNEFVKGFLPGTHAYMIDRTMAKYLIENCRSELKIPLDTWYSNLGKNANRLFNGAAISRLRFSIVSQDVDSESDLQF